MTQRDGASVPTASALRIRVGHPADISAPSSGSNSRDRLADCLEIAILQIGQHYSTGAKGLVWIAHPGDPRITEHSGHGTVTILEIDSRIFDDELSWMLTDPSFQFLSDAVRSAPNRLDGAGCSDESGRDLWPLDERALDRMVLSLSALAHASLSTDVRRAQEVGHLALVLGEIAGCRRQPTDRPADPPHQFVTSACRVIEDDLAAEWSLASIARAVGISPGYLVRLFTTHLHVSPIAYLNERRAQRAARLLVQTDLSIGDVGSAVGWADPAYMSRRFRAEFALSPGRYRSAHRHS